MPSEEIIVLADSKKIGGRCIAGISTSSGEWIRPVSDLQDGTLYPFHCRVGRRLPELLDVVRFSHDGKTEDPAQPENRLIADEPWRLVGAIDSASAYRELEPVLSTGPQIFGNGGKGVDESVASDGIAESLTLIEPDVNSLEFAVKSPYHPGGNPRTRVAFQLGGWSYDLPLTDFAVRPKLLALGHGNYGPNDAELGPGNHVVLTVSLGLPMNSVHWKLVAGLLVVS
jgi:hypothetical protein